MNSLKTNLTYTGNSTENITESSIEKSFYVSEMDGYWAGNFEAMASPCEVLIKTDHKELAIQLTRIAYFEAKRIESKFSRYRNDNIIYQINNSTGEPIAIDGETYKMLHFAEDAYQISQGLFDVTSGILRHAWHFDGSSNIPSGTEVSDLLKHVGWDKITLTKTSISKPKHMEIDLGGFAKEYAVDRTLQLLDDILPAPILVNYGGDIATNGSKYQNKDWHVAVENPASKNKVDSRHKSVCTIQLSAGGLATSGDSRRYLLKDGIRYGHILNPLTGWPLPDAPHSITVAANSCLHAGLIATLGLLHGKSAHHFLNSMKVEHWIF